MASSKILYDNILASGVTATDTETGYSVDNIYDLRPYTYWQAASAGANKYIDMDAGSAVDVDALGIYSHNLSGGSIKIYSSATGAFGGEETQRGSTIYPSDNTLIFETFTSASARYWRIQVYHATNAPRIGVAILGEALTFSRKPAPPYDPRPTSIVSSTAVTKTGNALGTTVNYKPISITAKFKHLDWDTFANDEFLTFWDDHGSEGKHFFWSVDSDTYDTYFVKLTAKSKLSRPMTLQGTVDQITLDMEGVSE